MMLRSSPDLARTARDLARAASTLAREASAIALDRQGPGHAARVAQRAADQALEAAQTLDRMAESGENLDATIQVATWALTAAAVALTQAKIEAGLAT